ncbi:hypothetical protein F5887DRAFT_919572 [Amanita rubescens]|nr:hypothetical protein F5887DRAFT_919572 [Amanita rubescens]
MVEMKMAVFETTRLPRFLHDGPARSLIFIQQNFSTNSGGPVDYDTAGSYSGKVPPLAHCASLTYFAIITGSANATTISKPSAGAWPGAPNEESVINTLRSVSGQSGRADYLNCDDYYSDNEPQFWANRTSASLSESSCELCIDTLVCPKDIGCVASGPLLTSRTNVRTLRLQPSTPRQFYIISEQGAMGRYAPEHKVKRDCSPLNPPASDMFMFPHANDFSWTLHKGALERTRTFLRANRTTTSTLRELFDVLTCCMDPNLLKRYSRKTERIPSYFSGFCSAAYMLRKGIDNGAAAASDIQTPGSSALLSSATYNFPNNMKFSATILMAVVCASAPAFALPGYYPQVVNPGEGARFSHYPQVVTLGEEYCLPGCWPAPPLPNVCPLRLVIGECSKCCT